MNLGLLEGCGRGEFLSGRKARRTVDRRSTATSASGHIQPRRGKELAPRPRLWPRRGGGVARVRASRPWALLGHEKSAGLGALVHV